jgi:hypothetical protein
MGKVQYSGCSSLSHHITPAIIILVLFDQKSAFLILSGIRLLTNACEYSIAITLFVNSGVQFD